MKRLVLPLALVALLAGCGQLPFFGPQSGPPAEVVPDTVELYETTQVVREIHEVPVYYVDTVYVEEEPAPAETVLVVEEYVDEYETVVMVPGHGHPRRPRQRWSPGLPDPPRREQPEREPGQRGQRPDDPDPRQPSRGQRQPKPQPQPTPPDETVAEETQPRDDPGRGFVPVEFVEEELPLIASPPVEPVAPVASVPSAPPAPASTERPAPSSSVEADASTQPSEDESLNAEQPAARGVRPARGQRPESEKAESEGADQVADSR